MTQQPLLIEADATFHDSPDGLIIRKAQHITDQFLTEAAEKRNATQARAGEFHEVADIPTGVVEVWKAQGFDIIQDRNIKARDIVNRLRREGLEAFITTNKRV